MRGGKNSQHLDREPHNMKNSDVRYFAKVGNIYSHSYFQQAGLKNKNNLTQVKQEKSIVPPILEITAKTTCSAVTANVVKPAHSYSTLYHSQIIARTTVGI